MVQFRPLNLLSDFSNLGMFDLVFCRNVLIYFDQPTKIGVLERIARVVERDGYLVLGAAETVVGLTDAFKPVADRRGLYSPNLGARLAAPRLRWSAARVSPPPLPGRASAESTTSVSIFVAQTRRRIGIRTTVCAGYAQRTRILMPIRVAQPIHNEDRL